MPVEPEHPQDLSGAEQAAAEAVQGSARGVEQLDGGLGITGPEMAEEVWGQAEATPGYALRVDRGRLDIADGLGGEFGVDSMPHVDAVTGSERPTWGELETVGNLIPLPDTPDGAALDTERTREFGEVYADLGSYFDQQLRSPETSVEYMDDAILDGIFDDLSLDIGELAEGALGESVVSKSHVPDSGFIRLSDTDQGRIIRLGITFKGESEAQPSENFGIELNLAETDGNVGVFKSKTNPDGTEEVLQVEKAQLSPDQMQNVSDVIHEYSPSGTEEAGESEFERMVREVEAEADADPTGQARAELDRSREFFAAKKDAILAARAESDRHEREMIAVGETAWGFPAGTGEAAFGLMGEMARMEEDDDAPDA